MYSGTSVDDKEELIVRADQLIMPVDEVAEHETGHATEVMIRPAEDVEQGSFVAGAQEQVCSVESGQQKHDPRHWVHVQHREYARGCVYTNSKQV